MSLMFAQHVEKNDQINGRIVDSRKIDAKTSTVEITYTDGTIEWHACRRRLSVHRPERTTFVTPQQAEQYPECEKLRKVHNERRAINEFIEWAGNDLANAGADRVDQLVMAFYGIDPDRLEAERREILSKLQKDAHG